jgi:hypothetical protein
MIAEGRQASLPLVKRPSANGMKRLSTSGKTKAPGGFAA